MKSEIEIKFDYKALLHAHGPYPEPENIKSNTRQAVLLAENYSGPLSELTAITQYVFHHLMAGPENEVAAQVILDIAIVEMRHLDVLGSYIKALGLRPEYKSYKNGGRFWNASQVTYGKTLQSMLEADIAAELSAIKQYRRTIELIKNEKINDMLRRIIADEEQHVILFKMLLNEQK